MRTLIAIAAVFAFVSGANAYCPALPDTAETGYTQNNAARALCLQQELARTAAEQARQTQLDTALERLQQNALQQRLQLQQLQTQTLLKPSYLAPIY